MESSEKPDQIFIPPGNFQQPVIQGVTQSMPGQTIVINNASSNGMAIASLVMGLLAISCFLLGFVVCLTFLVSWIFALLAIIFGHIGMSNSKFNGGSGSSIVGLICGYLTLAAYILPFLLLLAA